MIWISDQWKDYEVLDTSDGERLERWGKYILVRPDPQVIWNTPHVDPNWKNYDARYLRSNTGGGRWTDHDLPERWQSLSRQRRNKARRMKKKNRNGQSERECKITAKNSYFLLYYQQKTKNRLLASRLLLTTYATHL